MSIEKEYEVARRIHMQKEEECRQLRKLLNWVSRFLIWPGYSRVEIVDEINERMQQIDDDFS